MVKNLSGFPGKLSLFLGLTLSLPAFPANESQVLPPASYPEIPTYGSGLGPTLEPGIKLSIDRTLLSQIQESQKQLHLQKQEKEESDRDKTRRQLDPDWDAGAERLLQERLKQSVDYQSHHQDEKTKSEDAQHRVWSPDYLKTYSPKDEAKPAWAEMNTQPQLFDHKSENHPPPAKGPADTENAPGKVSEKAQSMKQESSSSEDSSGASVVKEEDDEEYVIRSTNQKGIFAVVRVNQGSRDETVEAASRMEVTVSPGDDYSVSIVHPGSGVLDPLEDSTIFLLDTQRSTGNFYELNKESEFQYSSGSLQSERLEVGKDLLMNSPGRKYTADEISLISEFLRHEVSQWKVPEHYRRAIGMVDHTALKGNETEEVLKKLVEEATEDGVNAAAICVYPAMVATVLRILAELEIRMPTAAVANFPSGNIPLSEVLKAIEEALAAGAVEIDLVLPYFLFMDNWEELSQQGQYHYLTKQDTESLIAEVARAISNRGILKVIIESSEIDSIQGVWDASVLSIQKGADFLKTSTGMMKDGGKAVAKIEHFVTMLQAIRIYNPEVGIKASGGIKLAEDTAIFLMAADLMLGKAWTDQYLRIGASTVLIDLRTKSVAGYGKQTDEPTEDGKEDY